MIERTIYSSGDHTLSVCGGAGQPDKRGLPGAGRAGVRGCGRAARREHAADAPELQECGSAGVEWEAC